VTLEAALSDLAPRVLRNCVGCVGASFAIESGPLDGAHVRLRAGRGKQIIELPSPQPWVMLVAEAR